MSQAEVKTSVVVVACDRPKLLERALKSLLSQQQQVHSIAIVDAGSQDPGVAHIIREYAKVFGMKCVTHRLQSRHPAAARNWAYQRFFQDGTELVLNLDDDDKYRPGFVAAMNRAFVSTGYPDILVPGQIIRERGRHGVLQQLHQFIPRVEDSLESWGSLLVSGGTFGLSITALQRFGLFNETLSGDEWARLLFPMILSGATIESAGISFLSSYQWLQHIEPDIHAQRRAEDRSTIVQVLGEAVAVQQAEQDLSAGIAGLPCG